MGRSRNTSKVIRQPDFCDDKVQNFARHITRNHQEEIEVQKILAMTPNSIERKRAIAALRKRGNLFRTQ